MNRGLYAGLPRTTARMRGLQVDGQIGATAVGDQTGQLVSTNTYIGYQAGQNTAQQASGVASGSGAGQWNTYIGYQAGQGNTSGDSNVAIGYQANSSFAGAQPQSSVFVGYQAGRGAAASLNSVNVGYQAGFSASGGGQNSQAVTIGAFAGTNSNVTAGVTIGYLAAYLGFSGTNAVIIGSSCCRNGSGSNSVAIGSLAGGNGAGTMNNGSGVIIGYQAGGGSGTGVMTNTNGVAIGFQACGLATVTNTNGVAIGSNAGYSQTAGSNVIVGYYAGYGPGASQTTANATTSGTGQTLIGYQTGQASSTAVSYITCLGWETTVGASGGVAIGTDHTGAAATTSTQDEIALGTANHTVHFFGGLKGTVVTKIANYAMAATDFTVLANGAITITLPAPTAGAVYVVKNISSSTVTVAQHASETIDGAASISMTSQYESVLLTSDGTNWFVLSANAGSIL